VRRKQGEKQKRREGTKETGNRGREGEKKKRETRREEELGNTGRRKQRRGTV